MPSTIVFNQTHIVGSDNNTLIYKFPTSADFKNHEIAVESVSINYSWVNISASLNNNKIQYKWYGTSGLTTYDVTFEDGLYEIADLNARLQYEMVKNGTYLINANSQNVYYAEFVVNPTRFAIQLNTYPVPNSSQYSATGQNANFVGWSVPVANVLSGTAGWVGFHSVPFNPQVNMLANDFYKIIGFASDFSSSLGDGYNSINLSYLSTTAPAVQPNTNIYLALQNIQNPYANPSTIIHNMIVTGSFGSQILDKPSEFAFSDIIKGQYSQFRLQFLGADLKPLKILDPDIVVVLLIREKKMTS